VTKSIFRATAVLSASSVVTIVFGFVSAKILAVKLQPSGYGYYGLLQSFVGLMTLIVGLGMATSLVRLGAGAATRNDEGEMASLRMGAWALFAGLAVLSLSLISIFRNALSRWALGTPDHGWAIVLMGVALIFAVASQVQVGVLNAYHRVGALAKGSLFGTLVSSAITISAVLIWGIRGVVPSLVIGAVATWVVYSYFVWNKVGPVRLRTKASDLLKSSWKLARFGGPYTLSVLVGTGIQFILPIVVLHLLDTNSVGYYKAASAISVGYLGFLVTAMGQDYYPRVSAIADQPDRLIAVINEQHRLVMLIAVPIVLGMLACVPILVPIVYSHKFMPTIEILEWQLIGDIFKFSSWTMSFAILARCSSTMYFLTEVTGGIASILATGLAVHWFGLNGLGIGFLAAYVIYYLIVWAVIRREIHLKWSRQNIQMLLGAVAAAVVVRILPATPFAAARTPVALVLALIFAVPSLFIIAREVRGGKPGLDTDTEHAAQPLVFRRLLRFLPKSVKN
jgi:antigen flippase